MNFDLNSLGQVAGITGVTGVAILGGLKVAWNKTAPARVRRSSQPLVITAQENADEPGHIWALATDDVLEREDFVPAMSRTNRGSFTPNLFRRDILKEWKLFDIYPTNVSLIIRNPHGLPVYVTAIEAIIESKSAPPAGTLITNPPQGDLGVRKLHIDLDAPTKHALSRDGSDYFSGHKLELASRAQEFVELSAETLEEAYEWRLKLTLSVEGKGSTQIWPPLDQAPFRTAGQQHAYDYQRYWVCSPVVVGSPGLEEPPYLHDGRRDYL